VDIEPPATTDASHGSTPSRGPAAWAAQYAIVGCVLGVLVVRMAIEGYTADTWLCAAPTLGVVIAAACGLVGWALTKWVGA
jgi:hypothetical protein